MDCPTSDCESAIALILGCGLGQVNEPKPLVIKSTLDTSLALVEKAAHSHATSIIDIGGGESTLVDDLLARGYENISVLDVSLTAIDVTKRRLGLLAEQVNWIVADIVSERRERCLALLLRGANSQFTVLRERPNRH
jgi:hypothetical protein